MKLILIFMLTLSLYANIKQDMLSLYQNKRYYDSCTIGLKNFEQNKRDEEFVSLYAFSCLYSDHIDRLAVPITLLKKSSESRSNSAYFSVILMQKKLLYHALIDNYDLSSLDIPSTDYVLSKVFDFYTKLGMHEPRSSYLFEDKNDKKLIYKLYIAKDDGVNKIVIEQYYDTITIKRHMYW